MIDRISKPETLSLKEEEYWIRQSVNDPHAFKVLYEHHFKRIFTFVLNRMEDKSLAADITQQVFIKALQKLSQFRFKGLPFSAWLYRIAINQCNSFYRKSKKERLVVLEEDQMDNLFEEMDTDKIHNDWLDQLPFVLEKLLPNQLYLIELRFFEGMQFKEIAQILNVTESNAKIKTYRTLEKMKNLFKS